MKTIFLFFKFSVIFIFIFLCFFKKKKLGNQTCVFMFLRTKNSFQRQKPNIPLFYILKNKDNKENREIV